MPSFQLLTTCLFLISSTIIGQIDTAVDYKDKDWKHHKTKNGIEIYTHIPEGEKLKELYLKFEIDATMDALLAALEDIPAQDSWVYKCNKSFVLEQTNERDFVYYIDSDFPFPATDRDIVIHYRRELADENGVVKTYSKGIKHGHEEATKYIRITDFSASYEITPISDTLMSVKYYMAADPAGTLPAWLINLAVSKGPVETIDRLRKIVKLEKYGGS